MFVSSIAQSISFSSCLHAFRAPVMEERVEKIWDKFKGDWGKAWKNAKYDWLKLCVLLGTGLIFLKSLKVSSVGSKVLKEHKEHKAQNQTTSVQEQDDITDSALSDSEESDVSNYAPDDDSVVSNRDPGVYIQIGPLKSKVNETEVSKITKTISLLTLRNRKRSERDIATTKKSIKENREKLDNIPDEIAALIGNPKYHSCKNFMECAHLPDFNPEKLKLEYYTPWFLSTKTHKIDIKKKESIDKKFEEAKKLLNEITNSENDIKDFEKEILTRYSSLPAFSTLVAARKGPFLIKVDGVKIKLRKLLAKMASWGRTPGTVNLLASDRVLVAQHYLAMLANTVPFSATHDEKKGILESKDQTVKMTNNNGVIEILSTRTVKVNNGGFYTWKETIKIKENDINPCDVSWERDVIEI